MNEVIAKAEKLNDEITELRLKIARKSKQRKYWLRRLRDLNDIESKNILEIEEKKAMIAEFASDDLNFLDSNLLIMFSEELNDFFRKTFVEKTFSTVFDSQWDLPLTLMCCSNVNILFI